MGAGDQPRTEGGDELFTPWRPPFSGPQVQGFPRIPSAARFAHIGRVKICIQHQGTRKFLRGIDTWVESMEGARSFENSMEALRHCVNYPIGHVNIVIDRGMARTPIIIAVEGGEQKSKGAPIRAVA